MSAAVDPYVKVYYRIADDDRFERVYHNDAALATWLRLLLLADGMWPASAPVPRWCRKASLDLLVEVGLIEIGTGYRYRIHGMDAERSKRSDKAANASRQRWTSNAPGTPTSNAPSIPKPMPLRTEQINSDQNSSPQRISPPAGAKKNGSNDLETDVERLARYRSLRDDPSKNADIRYAAKNEVERLEALANVH